jgi:hypothetical protein
MGEVFWGVEAGLAAAGVFSVVELLFFNLQKVVKVGEFNHNIKKTRSQKK